ncbi:hypothetical protein M0R45_037573 [Rubus argutus]|uniref:Uncharacterized protein n=1 Tax=Rubus argutus TaxID=59490 RepID=A0AAW1VZC2_RUBAR
MWVWALGLIRAARSGERGGDRWQRIREGIDSVGEGGAWRSTRAEDRGAAPAGFLVRCLGSRGHVVGAREQLRWVCSWGSGEQRLEAEGRPARCGEVVLARARARRWAKLGTGELCRSRPGFGAAKDDLTTEYQALLVEEEQKVELLKLRLKIGKERSLSQTKEIASLRAAQHEQSIEYRKHLMEEKQKNKELSEEVEKLQQLQEVLIASRLKDTKDAELCITDGGHVSRETTKHTKRTGGRNINNFRA